MSKVSGNDLTFGIGKLSKKVLTLQETYAILPVLRIGSKNLKGDRRK